MTDQLPQVIAWAQALADANLLPESFRKNPANIIFAAEIARDLRVSPVTAMRGIYVTQGRVGFYSHFMLALANRSGAFESPVHYDVQGSGDDLAVTASVTLRGGYLASETVSMETARAEGWVRNSKYKTIPVQMLKKRAVRMLIDNYCPEVLSGMGVGEDDATEETAPQSAPSVVARVLQKVAHSACDRDNSKALLAELDATTPPREPEPPRLDLDNPDHIKMVSTLLDSFKLGTQWRTKHRAALKSYLEHAAPPGDEAGVLAALREFVRGTIAAESPRGPAQTKAAEVHHVEA